MVSSSGETTTRLSLYPVVGTSCTTLSDIATDFDVSYNVLSARIAPSCLPSVVLWTIWEVFGGASFVKLDKTLVFKIGDLNWTRKGHPSPRWCHWSIYFCLGLRLFCLRKNTQTCCRQFPFFFPKNPPQHPEFPSFPALSLPLFESTHFILISPSPNNHKLLVEDPNSYWDPLPLLLICWRLVTGIRKTQCFSRHAEALLLSSPLQPRRQPRLLGTM